MGLTLARPMRFLRDPFSRRKIKALKNKLAACLLDMEKIQSQLNNQTIKFQAHLTSITKQLNDVELDKTSELEELYKTISGQKIDLELTTQKCQGLEIEKQQLASELQEAVAALTNCKSVAEEIMTDNESLVEQYKKTDGMYEALKEGLEKAQIKTDHLKSQLNELYKNNAELQDMVALARIKVVMQESEITLLDSRNKALEEQQDELNKTTQRQQKTDTELPEEEISLPENPKDWQSDLIKTLEQQLLDNDECIDYLQQRERELEQREKDLELRERELEQRESQFMEMIAAREEKHNKGKGSETSNVPTHPQNLE